jgi:hypothetical protein
MPLDPADVAVDTFAAPGTPSALLAGAEGTVATHVAVGGDGVMELLTHSSLVRHPADDEQPTQDENVRTYA